MCVKVDQTGHDDQPAHIDDLGTAGGEVARDFTYFSVAESDVGRLARPLAGSMTRPPLRTRSTIRIPHINLAVAQSDDARVRERRRGRCSCDRRIAGRSQPRACCSDRTLCDGSKRLPPAHPLEPNPRRSSFAFGGFRARSRSNRRALQRGCHPCSDTALSGWDRQFESAFLQR